MTELTRQEKAISLFEFIKELNKLKQKAVRNMGDYPWCRTLSQLPRDPDHIRVYCRDRVEEDAPETEDAVLLAVRKPVLEPCPEPEGSFAGWLIPGWDNFRNDAAVRSFTGEGEGAVYFSDDAARAADYSAWTARRQAWAERQKVLAQTRNLFAELYRLYFELQRDAETMEFIVANGVLCDRADPGLRHPVLTKRAKLRFEPDENTIYLDEVEAQSELYSILFQTMEDINLSAVNRLQDELQRRDYHPLDRNETPAFLKALVHQLSSDSVWSPAGIPAGWMKQARLLLYGEPCYIVRRRLDGTPKAIERIVDQIRQTGFVPAPIGDIVSGGQVDIPGDGPAESVEEQLAAVGGESVEILLSKEANKEQLEIAKRIEQYNAVLVQGPPGTGKTHTIANLMGHFLARGQSVLVTSHTPKALNVLKDKVAPGLRNLCVCVTEDSNADMERSIDGITEYMSRVTAHELKRDMESLAADRQEIIGALARTRREIFRLIRQECGTITLNGEEISPSAAAAFVLAHQRDLSFIPGKVSSDGPLPLDMEELTALYRSNEDLTAGDERELATALPGPEEYLSPESYAEALSGLAAAEKRLAELEEATGWHLEEEADGEAIAISDGLRRFTIDTPGRSEVQQLRACGSSFRQFEAWMKAAAVDGRAGGAYRARWEKLLEQIERTCAFAETVMTEQFGLGIRFEDPTALEALAEPFEKLQGIFAEKGRVSKLALLFHKDCEKALGQVKVEGRPVRSAEECGVILHIIELERMRHQCAVYWDELLAVHGVPRFADLDREAPERVAANWIPAVCRYLDWYRDAYGPLAARLKVLGIPEDVLFSRDPLDSDLTATDKILSAVARDIPALCDGCEAILDIGTHWNAICETRQALESGGRVASALCCAAAEAIEAEDPRAYDDACGALARMYEKYTLRQRREELLDRLAPAAFQWAEAIRRRKGIHGGSTVPENIREAWKWKQLSALVEEITAQPFARLQQDSLRLSGEYRTVTAAYAEKCAWYHLMRRTEGDIDMRQALLGWKQTIKKIGKGTGKNAPALKAKARELMSRCQAAVPGWIMPINRALETLDPGKNSFDVIIIDEASQSDISSLAILYMGRKLIIVGDDKQVSPMAVGVEVDKMNALQQMYIRDRIPNAHLYDAKTSVYDIGKTTFQPLMLREHFRCVPEIIGFSNLLSYDGKIKPLRASGSSTLVPAVVDYRVAEGRRTEGKKVNPGEAAAIVALIRACMEQPEYSGKTFGIISLLGDDQVKRIQQEIEARIDPRDIIGRRILCGNASHFQGDERDVVFLSLVDSAAGDGPLHLQGFGVDDAYRKRYNVAASRARDQLWVVHSLDPANDLKPGDIRKTLIDYAMNPGAFAPEPEEAPQGAAPFEAAVAEALADRGYHIRQQWQVGAYRLDMVALCGGSTVAIECDGEGCHSGETRIRADMERQTILQRLGWRFIRVRGSEYYRDPEKTLDRIGRELARFGITPEDRAALPAPALDLADRVRARAAALLAAEKTTEI